MDETTNNFTLTSSTGYTDIITTSSTAGADLVWASTADLTTFVPDSEFSSWEPYLFEKYTPKWHIIQGYKIQIKTMWK